MQEAKGIFAAEEALRQTTSVEMTSLDEPDVVSSNFLFVFSI